MDFEKILLDGLIKKRGNFPDYLYRQYKNAPEDIPPDEFFGDLKEIAKNWEENIKRQLYRDKREWTLPIKDAQERGDKEALKRRKEALNSLDINDYSLNIGGQYLLNMNDIHFLKASIEQAYTTSVKETINEIQTVINEKEDQNWEDLRRDLVTGGYLQGSTKELFNSALNGNYPANEAKMIWTKSRREAAVFCDWLGWKNSEWKKCFQFSKGRPFLEGDDYKKFEVYKQTQKINQILSKYTNKEKFRY